MLITRLLITLTDARQKQKSTTGNPDLLLVNCLLKQQWRVAAFLLITKKLQDEKL